MPVCSVEEAIREIREGRTVIVVDDEGRENEGDLVVAAEKVTPEIINFMAKEGRGLICVALNPERVDRLGLQPMQSDDPTGEGTAFTVSVDAREGITTGISAHDRYRTTRVLIDEKTTMDDLKRPGHVFPLRAREGGVLKRAGHTEAAVDLATLAGLYPAGVICEIMKEDGTMARLPDLEKFAEKHGLKIVSIASLIEYRLARERSIERYAESELPTIYGQFRIRVYREVYTGAYHIALVQGEIAPDEPVVVRVQSECLTGDVFGSLRCDCGPQMHEALRLIQQEGRGVFVYMRQEGRGIGLHNKVRAYALQDEGLDTVEANQALGFPPDLRKYGIGAQILRDCGVRRMRLMTNNPKKIVGLEGFGLELVERVPLEIPPLPENARYLKAKKERLGHIFHLPL
ncbi:MAG: bifunctional 3,4-dihydroxy-2-butanone-4-phosphate synthase/GTP cyclohydrolase II [bacterium JZ-2024 1]